MIAFKYMKMFLSSQNMFHVMSTLEDELTQSYLFSLGMTFYPDIMGLGELIQSNPLGGMVTNSGKGVAKYGSSTFQPQARQQQLPQQYSLNPQIPAIQVIYVTALSNLLLTASIISLLSKTF